MSKLLFLDFESTITMDDFLDQSTDYGLTPNLIYPTYNHKASSHRFRAVYILDRVIKNQKVYKYLLKGLGELFPQTDKKCLDASRSFFGTNRTGENKVIG